MPDQPPLDAAAARSAPAAWVLGLGGLLPFAAGAVLLWTTEGEVRANALAVLLGYAAVILSFLGGARWGLEIADRHPPRPLVLTFSVLPSLAAWGLLAGTARPLSLELSGALQLWGFVLAFLIQGAWDLTSMDAPDWYPRLRVVLTVGAAVCLIVAALAAGRAGL